MGAPLPRCASMFHIYASWPSQRRALMPRPSAPCRVSRAPQDDASASVARRLPDPTSARRLLMLPDGRLRLRLLAVGHLPREQGQPHARQFAPGRAALCMGLVAVLQPLHRAAWCAPSLCVTFCHFVCTHACGVMCWANLILVPLHHPPPQSCYPYAQCMPAGAPHHATEPRARTRATLSWRCR